MSRIHNDRPDDLLLFTFLIRIVNIGEKSSTTESGQRKNKKELSDHMFSLGAGEQERPFYVSGDGGIFTNCLGSKDLLLLPTV